MADETKGAVRDRRNRFVSLLENARRGDTLDELDEKLGDLLEAVRRTGKGGALHVTFRVALASKGDNGTLTVNDSVRAVIPEADRALTVMYATDDNLLQRNDPRQGSLELAVPTPKPEANAEPAQAPRPALVK